MHHGTGAPREHRVTSQCWSSITTVPTIWSRPPCLASRSRVRDSAEFSRSGILPLQARWECGSDGRRSLHVRAPLGYAEAMNQSQTARTRQDAASTIGYFDPQQPVADLLGNLPHWRQEGVTYFVTFRLADSIPQAKLELWLRQHEDWLARHPPPHDPQTRQDYYDRFVQRFQRWLDAGHGSCVLQQPAIRKIVADAIPFFDGARYRLREWVVMPNHVHIIVTPLPSHELSTIVHSWKSYTANQINRHLGAARRIMAKGVFRSYCARTGPVGADRPLHSCQSRRASRRLLHATLHSLNL